MPHQTEPSANNALGNLLQGMLGKATVRSENTQVIQGHAGLQPDILITNPGRSPVVIEAEYDPAQHVEPEARDRLNLKVAGQTRPIEAVIALRYPEAVGDAHDLSAAIGDAALRYCVFTAEGEKTTRFPESGWLDGSVTDLADLVRLVSVPQNAVDQAATFLQQGIDDTANILEEMHTLKPAITADVARLLGMDNVPQTRRMACAIVANAMIFHERIAGMHEGIQPLNLVCGNAVPDPQDRTLEAWTAILKINYWPIFAIGKDILEQLPSDIALRVLRRLRLTAASVNGTGVNNAHDLTGRVFQRLISDRKYLATFYTLPASAALLARLAVAKLEGVDWGDPKAIDNLKVGDFACGTGALLSAVYEQIAARHESAGGDAAAIHPVMMEEVLYGCDVLPSAIHITASSLAGLQPNVGFKKARLYTMPYGRTKEGSVAIGSLEFLNSDSQLSFSNYSDPALQTGSTGEETASQVIAEVPDGTFDLVIMNPPFTSNTKGFNSEAGVIAAAFAAFNASPEDQKDMASRIKLMAANTCYHGHAGMASAFAELADRKVRSGGVVALVLPFTAINGASWAKFRELIATKYRDLTIVSLSASSDHDLSFSADTGMAECLVIGRKEDSPMRGQFTSLHRRPRGFAHAAAISSEINNRQNIRKIEDGPYGGTFVTVGNEVLGESLTAPTDNYESGWGIARILDGAIAQVANSLSRGVLWLPGQSEIQSLPMASLCEIGKRGVDHQFFVSEAHNGPFFKMAPSPTATFPALWNHSAKNETKLICCPDGRPSTRRWSVAPIWQVSSPDRMLP